MKGALLAECISRDYDAIAAGKTIGLRLIVPSRLETIGFELRREKEEIIRGQPCLKILLHASPWIIRQFAGNITFWVNIHQPHGLVQYEGRIIPTNHQGNILSGMIFHK